MPGPPGWLALLCLAAAGRPQVRAARGRRDDSQCSAPPARLGSLPLSLSLCFVVVVSFSQLASAFGFFKTLVLSNEGRGIGGEGSPQLLRGSVCTESEKEGRLHHAERIYPGERERACWPEPL